MIKKIKKLKNLGIFKEYTSDRSFPDFKKYNLIYGWNGSGKTTLSKLFSFLNIGNSKEYSDLQYEIEYLDESNQRQSITQDVPFQEKIRVFNQEYIRKNIGIDEGKANLIFILGEENNELVKEISKNEIELEILENQKGETEKEKNRKEKEKGEKFTSIAKVIGANLVGSSMRNYRKPDAERDFKILEKKEILEKEKISEYEITLRQEQKNKLQELQFSIDLKSIYNDISTICKKTVESEIISRLKENSDISDWVEKGIVVHQIHKSKECEFCKNTISESRLLELSKHFSEADKLLKEEIENEIKNLEEKLEILKIVKPYHKVELYKELQTQYESRVLTFNKEKQNLSLEISEIIIALKDKKIKTTEEVIFTQTLENNFSDSVDLINEILEKHNKKTDNFQKQKDKAGLKLKNHYLSEIFDDVNVLETDIENCKKRLEEVQRGSDEKEGINKLKDKIQKDKAKISSEHKACEILNKNLETFLGRKEIRFDVSLEGGYTIHRNGVLAQNLSEGEQTAIAFVYFVVHLQDKEFDLKNGIIVVDDPISSLDSNSLFQAFSFLKNSVKGAKQIFVFTHNFEYFKLVNNWMSFYRGKTEKFLIKNYYKDKERFAEIDKIDPFLDKYHTEYEYLLKCLFDFKLKTKENLCIQDTYHIPNIGRKVLETFLMFRIPGNDGLSKKIKYLEDENIFDNNKLTAINKFFNDQSHITGSGFDPSLIQESQKNVKYLLDMIKALFPKHYELFKKKFSEIN